MRRRAFKTRALAALAGVLASLLLAGAGHASSRSDAWLVRAQAAIDAFAAGDNGNEGAMAYAEAAGAIGNTYGWTDPRVQVYLNDVYALANPDGGYGLGYAYDFAGDGTVNPATTTYTVTLAGHVGPVLLAGYLHGVVPAAKVQTIVSLLMSTARINTPQGACIAYSRSANDNKPALCTHNANAGAGAFLLAANSAGIGQGGLMTLVVDITRRETGAYFPTGGPHPSWWHYLDTPSWNDSDHNSYDAESMYSLAYPVGRQAAWLHMTNAYADNAGSPLAHMRLTSLPAAPSSMSTTDPGTTVWCEFGDAWLSEFDAYVASTTVPQLAVAAWYASRNALAC